MVTGSTLTFFRRQPHDPDAGLRQARSCLREIVPVSMDEMTLPSAASDTGRRHVDGLPSAIKAVSLLSINRRIQMRQNNVDFQNRELRTNILALLLVTTRRVTSDDTQRHQEQTAVAPLNQSNILARLLVTTRRVTPDDTQRHQTAIAPLNQCDGLAATRALVLRHCDFPDSSASPEMAA
jgi:hypothetical protein